MIWYLKCFNIIRKIMKRFHIKLLLLLSKQKIPFSLLWKPNCHLPKNTRKSRCRPTTRYLFKRLKYISLQNLTRLNVWILRIIDGCEISNLIVCDNSDFQSALTIGRVLLLHSAKVFGSLPITESNALNGQTIIRQTFFDNLPPEFDRKTYLVVAEKLKIPAKTAEKYISPFCISRQLKHLAHDSYGNP